MYEETATNSICDSLKNTTINESSNKIADSDAVDEGDESSSCGEQLLNSQEWLKKKKHVFILSESGKPVYSRYGQEDGLVTLYGLLQALVSIVSDDQDVLHCVEAGGHKFVFLVKSPLILAAVVDSDASVTQLLLQLMYVNSQVESVSTRLALQRTYDNRRNCDLRDLLGGTDRLINSLLDLLDTEPGLLLGAYRSLPLPQPVRSDVSQAIIHACAKIKNVVFGVVLTGLQVVTVVRLKGVVLHPADLHLLCNLVYATDSLRASEHWMPICLPQFDPQGYLYGHVSYLSDGCDACLILLTVDREHFFMLSQAKQKITEKLRRQHVLEKLITTAPPITYTSPLDSSCSNNPSHGPASDSAHPPASPSHSPGDSAHSTGLPYTVSAIGCPELRHFLYKNRPLAQYTAPTYTAPYQCCPSVPCGLYQRLHQRLHSEGRPLKMLYSSAIDHASIGWVTEEFELYALLEPLTTKQSAIVIVNKILKYVRQEESKLFLVTVPTF